VNPSLQLGEIAKLINGDRSSNYPSGEDIIDNGILFLNTKNIENNRLVLDETKFITQKKFDSLGRGKLQKNDLIITLRGSLGHCCLFDCIYDTGFINAQMMIIRVNSSVCVEYLYSYLTSSNMKTYFKKVGTGSAVPQLTAKQLSEVRIPLPPIKEQKRITAILDTADTIRRKRQRAIDLADQFLRSVFLSMFGDPVTNPKNLPVKELGEVATEKGAIKCGPFGSQLKIGEFVNNGILVYGIDNVMTDELVDAKSKYITAAKFSDLKAFSVEEGDVLISGRSCLAMKTKRQRPHAIPLRQLPVQRAHNAKRPQKCGMMVPPCIAFNLCFTSSAPLLEIVAEQSEKRRRYLFLK